VTGIETIRTRIRERLAEQRTLVQSLLRLREQLQGSLFARYAECGKETCVCRQGQKHGPYFVLSTRSGGQGGFAYLDGRRAQEAERLVSRHRDFKAGFRRLKKVNAEIVSLLRRYQQQMSRQGGRRLGLKARGQGQKLSV
jgi:Family of unknown function (DUF6788)